MTINQSVISGFAGAVLLTLVHESARKALPGAPRMDLLGMRAIARGYSAVEQPLPARKQLYQMAIAGDLIANGLYYSLAGLSRNKWIAGTALGLAAGIGGVVLPGPLGLGHDASARTPQTRIMTVAWYLLGGLTAAAVSYSLKNRNSAS